LLPLKDNIPTRRTSYLTIGLIVANVLMFIFFQGATFTLGNQTSRDFDENVAEYGFIPYELTHPGDQCVPNVGCGSASDAERAGRQIYGSGYENVPSWLTIFTAMFMHGSFLHIAGNMLFLWIFGNNIEDSMGRGRFIAFYLLGGIAAALLQTAVGPDSQVPNIGASGAVAAVLGGYALLYPRARVVTLIFIIFFVTLIELPALLVLGFWFLIQVWYGAADLTQPISAGGGVAYFAHIGGFVFGLLLIKLFANRVHRDYDRQLAVY
jgi:membrane associated rhomboid family serine protease